MKNFAIKTEDYKLTPISRFRYKIEVFSFSFGRQEARQINKCYFSGTEKAWVMPQGERCVNQFLQILKSRIRRGNYTPQEKAINDMHDQMTLKRYSENTIRTYLDIVKNFFAYYPQTDPAEITAEQFKDYFLHLFTIKKISYSFQKQVVSAVKFYFKRVIRKDTSSYCFEIPRSTEERLPMVLTKEEVKLIIDCTSNLKQRVILMTIYSSGLRLSEVVNLKIADIDSERMMIYVRGGKGKKDRTTLLSLELLKILRIYYLEYRPRHWLFEGRDGSHYSKRSVQEIFKKALRNSGVDKSASVHTLRHSFATHLLEDGVDLRNIQNLLGHCNLKTSEIYTHITRKATDKIRSPLDSLDLDVDA
jgi:integrase/recombinase XerD